MLKTRLITGVLLIGFVFWSIFSLPAQIFVFIAGILSFAMMREWINVAGVKHRLARVLLLDLFVIFEFITYWFLLEFGPLFWAISLFWLLVLPFLIFAQRRQAIPKIKRNIQVAIGYLTLLMFFAGLLQLRISPAGDTLVLMAFVIVWCSDSLAYVAGRLFGKHKLIPMISPGKTWEGLIGSAILTLPLLMLYWVYVMHRPFPGFLFYGLMLYLVIMAVVGDLFESCFKRINQVKDSGTFLPGHGGLLDRFDSLMAVTPVFALFTLMGWL